jgi:hypothetical protein
MNKFDVPIKYVGIYPGNACAQVRHLYNRLPNAQKIKFLINERSLPATVKGDIIKEFESRQTTDINAGELLGIGVVGSYFNVKGQSRGRSYQSVVGIEDAAKSLKETLLSDGAIWENETKKKMMFQQTLVQGYFPKEKQVTTINVIKAVNDKIEKKRRGDYPKHSGLIVNIFAKNIHIDINEVIRTCDVNEFTSVFCICYNVPTLSQAIIYLLEKGASPTTIEALKMGFNISEFGEEPDWKINTDPSKW